MLYKENITTVTAHAHVSCSMHTLVTAHAHVGCAMHTLVAAHVRNINIYIESERELFQSTILDYIKVRNKVKNKIIQITLKHQ